MQGQRTGMVLGAVALLLGAGVYLHETQLSPSQEKTQEQTRPLFNFEESTVETVNLTTQAQKLTFVRNPQTTATKPPAPDKPRAASAQKTNWLMTTPSKQVAQDGAVAYLLNLMATGKSQQTLSIPLTRRAEFGFDRPAAIVEVTLKQGTTHRLLLGKSNFNRTGLYALVDPPQSSSELTVLVVSTDFENAVNRPLKDWQQ